MMLCPGTQIGVSNISNAHPARAQERVCAGDCLHRVCDLSESHLPTAIFTDHSVHHVVCDITKPQCSSRNLTSLSCGNARRLFITIQYPFFTSSCGIPHPPSFILFRFVLKRLKDEANHRARGGAGRDNINGGYAATQTTMKLPADE